MSTMQDYRKIVRAKYPKAFGWREFSTSDYTVQSGTGKTLASGYYSKDVWETAAKAVLSSEPRS